MHSNQWWSRCARFFWEQPIDISDDEELGQVFYQSEFQNMYIDIGGGDHASW